MCQLTSLTPTPPPLRGEGSKRLSRGSTEPRLDYLVTIEEVSYFFFLAAFLAAGFFFAAFFFAAIILYLLRLVVTNLGDEISETMAVVSKWVAHSHLISRRCGGNHEWHRHSG
jgi:hypothetical protein